MHQLAQSIFGVSTLIRRNVQFGCLSYKKSCLPQANQISKIKFFQQEDLNRFLKINPEKPRFEIYSTSNNNLTKVLILQGKLFLNRIFFFSWDSIILGY